MGTLKDQCSSGETVEHLSEQPRKYEIDESDKGALTTRIAAGLVIGAAIGLLKNILYPQGDGLGFSQPASAAEHASALPLHGNVMASPGAPDLPPGSDERGSGEPSEQPPPVSGHAIAMRAARTFVVSPGEGGSTRNTSGAIPQPGNDNESLYGAEPGSRVSALHENAHDVLTLAQGLGHSVGSIPSGSQEEDVVLDGADDDTTQHPHLPHAGEEGSNQDGGDPQRTNRAPVVTRSVQLPNLLVNQSIIIGLSDLLAHASDPDRDKLAVRELAASSGNVKFNGDGTWLFTPGPDDTGNVTLTYVVSDGQSSTTQTASIDLIPPLGADVVGTEGTDTVVGTAGNDTIAALGGSDSIESLQGDDLVEGGDGDDRISAGSGNDLIFAGAGNDVVFGGGGDDRIFGGAGDDHLMGEEGDDEIYGEDGNDTQSGGTGDDFLGGGAGDDELHGDDGNDELDGGDGSDKIAGDAGNDKIRAGSGADEATGGDGNDLFCATVDDGDDEYDGGADIDTYDLSATSADAVVDLPACFASSPETGRDRITAVEIVIGGKGRDVIIADDAANVLTGGPGDDTFVFRSSASAGMGAGVRDKILDFDVGDKIDLSEIDREFASTFGDALEDLGFRKFVLIQSGEAFTAPGQVRFSYEQFDDKEVTVVAGNIDDDTDNEFEIELYGHKDLKDDDFASHAPPLVVP